MSVSTASTDSIPYSDPLSPNARTWIDLGPVEPRIRDLVVNGYREMLSSAIEVGDTYTREIAIAGLARFGVREEGVS